jgi:hypothetical protein
MSINSASLILSTQSQLYTPTINTYKTYFTFYNINLRNIMGDMFDKYDIFTLKLSTASSSGNVTTGNSANSMIIYNLKGLDWCNINYDLSPNSNVWAPVCYYQSNSGTPANSTYGYANVGQGFNFRKSQEIVNLTFAVSLIASSNTITEETGIQLNNVVFQFIIEPVIPKLMNECASFTFNTMSTIPVPNKIINSTKTSYTYPSFDMRRLCGEFWDFHDEFEIFMSCYETLGSGTLAGNNTLVNVEMTGLNWSNNLVKQGNNTTNSNGNYTTTNAILGALNISTTGSTHWLKTHYNSAPVQFYKSSDFVNLVINFKNFDNTILYPATTFTGTNPRYQLQFYIRPIYKVPKATLFLNPFGLTTTETNLGITNNTTSFTLKNIDMRLLCRNMWEKYDKFNIFLYVITSTASSPNQTNGSFLFELSGLDFINQTNIYSNKAITQDAILGSVLTQGTSTLVDSMSNFSSLVTSFYKTKDIVDLTFTALPQNSATAITHNALANNYHFVIVPIIDESEDI